MINEILFMETRIFREFCTKHNITAETGNKIFTLHKIWNYIESCYDMLHTNGDEFILNDIETQLRNQSAIIAIDQLLPDHLSDQFCFLSEKAVDCLKFQEAKKYVI